MIVLLVNYPRRDSSSTASYILSSTKERVPSPKKSRRSCRILGKQDDDGDAAEASCPGIGWDDDGGRGAGDGRD